MADKDLYRSAWKKGWASGINADVWLLGVTFVEISALTLAVEIAVSILKMRAPGMSLDRMPIFGWYMLVADDGGGLPAADPRHDPAGD